MAKGTIYKYRVITRLTADRVSAEEYESTKSFDDIAFILNNEHYEFLVLANTMINKKDIISVKEI